MTGTGPKTAAYSEYMENCEQAMETKGNELLRLGAPAEVLSATLPYPRVVILKFPIEI